MRAFQSFEETHDLLPAAPPRLRKPRSGAHALRQAGDPLCFCKGERRGDIGAARSSRVQRLFLSALGKRIKLMGYHPNQLGTRLLLRVATLVVMGVVWVAA